MASTNLSRANGSGSATTKFTYSVWLKYSGFVSGGQRFFSATGGSGDTYFRFNADGTMEISGDNSAATSLGYFITNRKFRDHSAWMHIVIKSDTTQLTQTDRFKLYINGVDEAGVGGYSTGTYPNQNADDNISLSSNTHYIGGAASSQYFNGLMTHIHYSDGYAYDASTFGETDSTSGIWKPKASPTGITYGTNGYFLKMENSGAMGTDSSGNSNTFTVSGNLTQNEDTPSNNFATLNPLPSVKIGTDCFYEYGGTNCRSSTTNFRAGVSGIYVNQGKWYFEMQQSNADCHIGIAGENKIQNGGTSGGVNDRLFYYEDTTGYAYSYNAGNGMIYFSTPSDGTQTASYGNAFGSSDTVGCFADLDNNKLYFSKNGTIQNSGTGYTIQGDIYYALGSSIYNGDTSLNYGNGSFKGVKLTGTTYTDANGEGIFKYSPNQAGASNFDSSAKNFYALNTNNLKEFG